MHSQKSPAAQNKSVSKDSQLASFFAGALAGSFSACVISPIEVVRAQMQGRQAAEARYRTPRQLVVRIAQREGFRGFYRGLPPSLFGILPGRGSQFWAYDTIKLKLSERFGESPAVHMASAAAGSAFSNTLTNPIWLIKSRLQLQAGTSPASGRYYHGYRDAILQIFREEGIGGYYKGLRASYWGVIEGAIHFMLYEQIVAHISDRENRSPIHACASGAISKLIASSLTYPHEVVRLRMRERPRFAGAPPIYTGMIQGIRLIAREEGRRGLYAGMSLHLARTVPNSALLFFGVVFFKNLFHEYGLLEPDEEKQLERSKT